MSSTNPDTSPKNKRKWRSSLSVDQAPVEISVDDCGTAENQTLMLHRGLLCSHSPYFHNAFKGEFRESEEKAIYLPDVTASTLRLFQYWVYGQVARVELERSPKKAKTDQRSQRYQGDSSKESVQATWSEGDLGLGLDFGMKPLLTITTKEFLFDRRRPFVQHMARLYAFAEVYDTPRLRHDVMTVLVQLSNLDSSRVSQRDCLKAVQEVYDALPSSSPICQYLVKRLAVHTSFEGTTRFKLEALPLAVVIDLLMVLGPVRGHRNRLEEEIRNSCNFHEHKSKDERIDCKGRQRHDVGFYVGFLRACMSEVYAEEDTSKDAAGLQKSCASLGPSEQLEDETLVGGEGHDK